MLTEQQKQQIRLMVINTTAENMERVSKLTDTEVLEELEIFKTSRLESLGNTKEFITIDIGSRTAELEKINAEIEVWS
jgi:hypothetical protein